MNKFTDIFNSYKVNYYHYQEIYYDWYRKADNLKSAIEKAFLGKDEQGKLHPHHYHVGHRTLEKAADIALERFDALSDNKFDTFDSIYQFVDSIRAEVKGFGLLATYDVALRIAKYQRCDVHKVYCHAGVTVGARALGFDAKDGQTITVDKFPTPLNQLSGDHLENLLCIYKGVLVNASGEVNKTCIRQCSRSALLQPFCIKQVLGH